MAGAKAASASSTDGAIGRCWVTPASRSESCTGESAGTALHVGPAYAVWTGIGAAGTAVLGMALFDEPATAARIGIFVTTSAEIRKASSTTTSLNRTPAESPIRLAQASGAVPAAAVTSW